jgi:O-antigen/teichoic acid export membrane protein
VRRLSGSGGISSIASACVTGLAGVVSGVLTARGLGAMDRGSLASLTTVPFLVMTLGCMGLDDALARAVARNEMTTAAATRFALVWGTGWGALISVLIWPLQDLLLLDGHGGLEAAIIVGLGPAFIITRLLNGITAGQGRYLSWNVQKSLGGIVYAIAIGVMFALGVLDLLGAVLAWTCAYAATMALALVSRRRDRQAHGSRVTAQDVKAIATFSVRVGTTKIGSQLAQRADLVALSLMVPLSDLGVYAVASTLALSPGVIVLGYSTYVFAICSRSGPMTRTAYLGFVFRGWALSGLIYGLIWLATPQIIALGFGDGFSDAILIARWLCVGGAVYYSTSVGVSILNARDRAADGALAQIASLVVILAVLPLSIAKFGVEGAAYAVVAGNLANAAFVGWAFLRLSRTRSHQSGTDTEVCAESVASR